MTTQTRTRPTVSVLLDIQHGGIVCKEFDDVPLSVQLTGFAPECACDVTSVEVHFPTLRDEWREPQTREYPGGHFLEVAYVGSDPALSRRSCLLPHVAQQLFEELGIGSEG